MTHDETATAVWCLASGHRSSGAQAVALAVSVAWGTSFPLQLWRVPGFGVLADAVYAFVARHRHRLR